MMYDVIIIGGSYAGLSAGMALGRALRNVLIIDSGKPCNRNTPHSHNFLTQDGKTPKEIASVARQQVAQYETVSFYAGIATGGAKTDVGFEIRTDGGDIFTAKKIIIATGLKDLMPEIEGLSDCWGISVIHCPYCHGYEVKNQKTGILGNGDNAYEFSKLISNWTKDLTLFTNGKSTLQEEQLAKLKQHNIQFVEKEIHRIEHEKGQIQYLVFKDKSKAALTALYARLPFEQHCKIPLELGCGVTEQGHLEVDMFQKTSVAGIYACGDSTTMMRTVSNAVATGTLAGVMANKELIEEEF